MGENGYLSVLRLFSALSGNFSFDFELARCLFMFPLEMFQTAALHAFLLQRFLPLNFMCQEYLSHVDRSSLPKRIAWTAVVQTVWITSTAVTSMPFMALKTVNNESFKLEFVLEINSI